MRRPVKETPAPDDYNEEYYLRNWAGFEGHSQGRVSLRHLKALEHLGPRPGEAVLDLGCGRGEFLQLCGSSGCIAIGMDYSSTAVKLSCNRGDARATVIRASATALPFREAVFDKVAMLDFVEHLAPDDLLACLGEVRRVLKGSGRVLIHTPNRWGDLAASVYCELTSRLRLPVGRGRLDPGTYDYYSLHVNVLSPLSLQRALRTAGFKSRVWFAGHPLQDVPRRWLVIDRVLFFLTTLWCKAHVA